LNGLQLWAMVQRWTDALQFRWDRHVVRFSDEDQMTGLAWLQAKAMELPAWRPGRRSLQLASAALILLLGFRLLRRWPSANPFPRGPQCIQALKPLLRKTRKTVPPLRGETARSWLLRLSREQPALRERLDQLAEQVDAASYGGRANPGLRSQVRSIARDFN